MKKSWPLIITICLVLMYMLPAFPAYADTSGYGQAPVIVPGSGHYLGTPFVAITGVSGTVYYTTDGSNPANSNTAIVYSDRFPVSRSELLLAAARTSSGWSSVASALFSVNGSAPKQSSIAASPGQTGCFRLSALSNREGQAVASIVYSGALGNDAVYVVKISSAGTGRAIGSKVITADNTGIVIGPIKEGATYQISIKQKGKSDQYYGAFSVQGDSVRYGRLPDAQKLFYLNENGVAGKVAVHADSARTTTYSGYHCDGGLIFSGFSSLFKAIDAISTWENGAYVLESNVGERVFTTAKNVAIYDMYQGATYYGSTTSPAAANAWSGNFVNSHVIYGNGRFYENSHASTEPPDAWALEPQSGGYVYKYSYASSTYEAVYETINFTQAKLRESTDDFHPYNAYVFIASQNRNGSAEGGIVCTAASCGNWYLYYKRTNTSRPTITSDVVCGSSLSGSTYRPDADLELVYSYADGSFTISVKNLSTNKVYSSNIIADNGVGGLSALISATSYVPITKEFTHTPDYQSGGFFENIDYSQCYLTDAQGHADDFWASSSQTHYLLEYNDDYCTDVQGSSYEEVNISYD